MTVIFVGSMGKLLFFRAINVSFLFAFKYYSDQPFYTCATQRIAFQVWKGPPRSAHHVCTGWLLICMAVRVI